MRICIFCPLLTAMYLHKIIRFLTFLEYNEVALAPHSLRTLAVFTAAIPGRDTVTEPTLAVYWTNVDQHRDDVGQPRIQGAPKHI